MMEEELAANHPEHRARRHRLRRRRRPDVVRQDRGAAADPPEPQGHHLAHHGRHRGRGALPVDLGVQGQGRADRPRHAEPDARVRQGRHRHRVRAVEPGRPRLPGRASPRRPRQRRHHRREGDTFEAGDLGEYTVGATASCCSATRSCSTRQHRRLRLLSRHGMEDPVLGGPRHPQDRETMQCVASAPGASTGSAEDTIGRTSRDMAGARSRSPARDGLVGYFETHSGASRRPEGTAGRPRQFFENRRNARTRGSRPARRSSWRTSYD